MVQIIKEQIRRLRRSTLFGLLCYCATAVLFSWRVNQIQVLKFDEGYYVNAARSLLLGQGDSNWEHPPLVKLGIALMMGIFGDGPVGWRVLSILSGAAIVMGLVRITQILAPAWAWFVAAAALLSQILFVESQQATLEAPVGALLIWAVFFVLQGMKPAIAPLGRTQAFALGGQLFGFALLSKWTAVPIWLVSTAFAVASCSGKCRTRTLFFVGVLPLIIYLMFWPIYHLFQPEFPRPLGFVERQIEMYRWLTVKLPPGLDPNSKVHALMTGWIEWPFSIQRFPVFYETISGHKVIEPTARAVILHGNPIIQFAGFIAVLVVSLIGLLRRQSQVLLIAVAYWLALLVFALPGRVALFYYYYTIPSLFLFLSWGILFKELELKLGTKRTRAIALFWSGLALAFVIYFLPLLIAEPISRSEYQLLYGWYFQ